MAGSLRYTAVLDACVLYPAALRDLLLSLAAADIFRGRWSAMIHDEWTRNLLKKRPELSREMLDRTVTLMNDAVEDCLVENHEYLIDALTLPDVDDRHVLAAAIAGHADAIVSFNLRDFPEDVLRRHGVEILHPDDFLVAQYGLNPVGFLTIIKEIRQRLQRPPRSAEELIAIYRGQGLPTFSNLLEVAIHLI